MHVRLDVDDVRRLGEAAPFAWSTYQFTRDGDLFVYRQTVGAGRGKDVGDVGWNGRELVAFRLHLPSKIRYHNTGASVGRGNILVWEQPLADRLRGAPLDARRADGDAVDSLPHALAVRRDVPRRGGRLRRSDLAGDAPRTGGGTGRAGEVTGQALPPPYCPSGPSRPSSPSRPRI